MGTEMLKPLEAAVLELAERQEGLVRRADLLRLGLGAGAIAHRRRTGRLHELHPGVYALGHRAVTRRAEFLAAVLWCGPGAALSHDSAAAFHGWLREDTDHPPPVHVSTTRNVQGRPGVVVHRTRHLDRRDVLRFGALWVTDDARTLIDLADDRTYPELRVVADQLPSLPREQLVATAARLPGRAGAGRTQQLIRSEDARTRSALERRFVRYCTVQGAPHPDGRNVLVAGLRVDCRYATARLVVELDSRAHHTRKAEIDADRRRDRALRRAGWDCLRLVWEDLEPGDPLAAQDLRARL